MNQKTYTHIFITLGHRQLCCEGLGKGWEHGGGINGRKKRTSIILSAVKIKLKNK